MDPEVPVDAVRIPQPTGRAGETRYVDERGETVFWCFPDMTMGPLSFPWVPQVGIGDQAVYMEAFDATKNPFDPAAKIEVGQHVSNTPPLLSAAKPVAAGPTGYQSFGYIATGSNEEVMLWKA